MEESELASSQRNRVSTKPREVQSVEIPKEAGSSRVRYYSMATVLDELGSVGWELVACIDGDSERFGSEKLVLKRPTSRL
jgi:hypothetical protein